MATPLVTNIRDADDVGGGRARRKFDLTCRRSNGIAGQQTIKIGARRNRVSEKSSTQIQAVGGRADQYDQRKPAKQSDGLERMNVVPCIGKCA